MNKPKVSVCMIVYNHEDFIEEAINGVLSQKTNFDVEFVISNDASTDNSDKVILDLIQDTRGIKINYFNHIKNKGMMENFIFSLEKCQGKYIALCEGDDYWTDPLKLQKQVDFLEGNPDYGICFHNVAIFDQANQKIIEDNITREVKETTDINELAKGNFIHTPSVMLRNDFVIPDWFKDSPIGDWTLYMLAIKSRKIKKLDEIMVVYRMHDTSVWSRLSQKVRNDKTRISVRLIADNLELPEKALKTINSRLKVKKKKKSLFQKVLAKLNI